MYSRTLLNYKYSVGVTRLCLQSTVSPCALLTAPRVNRVTRSCLRGSLLSTACTTQYVHGANHVSFAPLYKDAPPSDTRLVSV